MSNTSPVARRYATALVGAAEKQGSATIDRLVSELDAIAGAMAEIPALRHALLNPVFTHQEKQKFVTAFGDKYGLHALTRRLLALLVEKDRAGELPGIARAAAELADGAAGRVRAVVEVATQPGPAALTELKVALERRTHKSVALDVRLDPSLLGGMRTRIGSVVLDGSLRGQLERMKERLARS